METWTDGLMVHNRRVHACMCEENMCMYIHIIQNTCDHAADTYAEVADVVGNTEAHWT